MFGAALPLITVALMTLVQRRTPQAIMGRVSAAIEVVIATPQAVSLGSARCSSSCSATARSS